MIAIKNIFKSILVCSIFLLNNCKIQGELLWVKKVKRGKPPVSVLNFLAYEKKSFICFPLYHLRVSCDNSLVSYKDIEVFNSSFFPQYENELIELYKNSFLIITEKEIGEALPMEVLRTGIMVVELNSPQYYYLCEFDKPIKILSSEVIQLINSSKQPDLKTEKQRSKKSDKYYIVEKINLDKQFIILKEVFKKNGLYQPSTKQEQLKLNLEKHKKPVSR